jgi:protein-tyrosine phosphatase
METILVLCTGNLCRSPMAAAILRRALPHLRVLSAGLHARDQQPADPLAVHLMRKHRYDLGPHRAQPLSNWMVRAADLVLVMEERQRRAVESLYPGSRGKVFHFSETNGQDVPDPYGRGEDAFHHALELIEAGAVSWIDRLTHLSNRTAVTDAR